MALMFAGGMLLWRLYSLQRTDTLERQRIIALHASNTVASFIEDKREKLDWVHKLYASDPIIFAKSLSALTQEDPTFIEVAFIDARAEIIAGNSLMEERDSYLASFNSSQWYKAASLGEEVLISLRSVADRPGFLLAIPESDGGVIVGVVSLEPLQKSLATIGVGNGERAYVLAEDEILIAYSNPTSISGSAETDRYPNADEIAKDSGVVTIFQGYKGSDGPVIGTTIVIPNTGWRVVVEISEEVAYTQARESMWVFMQFLILVIALTIIQIRWISNKISKPITELAHAARMLGQGELSHRVELKTGNELDLLAKALNAMAGALAQALASLEQKAEDLKQAREAADRTSRSKSEFLASIGHDLRTPLNAILGYARILGQNKEKEISPEQQQEWLHTIEESAQHLSMIINDIVDLFKIEVQRLSVFSSDVQLHSLLAGVCKKVQTQAAEKNVELIYQPSPQLPTLIEVDPKRLQQVLLNLLDNAIKFTAKGGTVYFRVTLLKQLQSAAIIRFEIKDTGAGIAPDKLVTIFEPFEDGHSPHAQHGAGLGLAISQKLAQLMGSEGVKVESVLGKGSTFWFEIPVTVIAEEESATGKQRKNGADHSGGKKRILVVDDQPHDRAVLFRILSPLGFDMVEASDGVTGVILTLEQELDLIFMNSVMAKFNSIEAVRAIRLAGKDTPIIMLSESTLEQDLEHSRVAGSNDFLSKPLDLAELHDLLEKHLKVKMAWDYAAARERAKEAMPLTKIPPPDTLAVLHRLAIIGDMRALIDNAAELSRNGYCECAQSLKRFADQLRDKEILILIESWQAQQTEGKGSNPLCPNK